MTGPACCDPTTARREARQSRVLKIVFAVNLLLFMLMVAASLLSGSASVLSASLENFGDALTYALRLAVSGPAPPGARCRRTATHRRFCKALPSKAFKRFSQSVTRAIFNS